MQTCRTRMWPNRLRKSQRTERRSPPCWGRPGFTLLEMLVVVSVLALLAAVVATRIGGVHRRAAFEQAVAQWEFLDQQMRLEARRHNRPAELQIELGTGRLTLIRDVNDNNKGSIQSLGGNVRVTRYVSATRNAESGVVNVTYGPHGTSDSFAVKLQSASGQHQWMLVAGLSGQMTRLEKDSEVEDVLRTITPSGVYTR